MLCLVNTEKKRLLLLQIRVNILSKFWSILSFYNMHSNQQSWYSIFGDMKSFYFFTGFVCSSGLLLPDSKFLLVAKLSVCQMVNYYSISQTFWRWAQGKLFATATPHLELLHFSVLDKVLWVKCFSLFYFKTCSGTGIILRLWLNIL